MINEQQAKNKKSWFRRHKIITGIIIFLFLGSLMQAFQNAKEKATAVPAPVTPVGSDEQGNSIVAEQEAAPIVVEAEVPAAEPSDVPSTEPPASKDIAELTAADIKLSLQDLGFTCKGPDTIDSIDEYNVGWSCEEKTDGHLYYVDWFGRNATSIGGVSATAQDYVSKTPTAEMREFLGYVASLPYRGASPAEAKTWVEKTAAKSGEGVIGTKTIGDVEFCLTRAAQTLDLDIAKDCGK